MKKLIIYSMAVAFLLISALLVGAFLSSPKATHASAPKVPIYVSQPSSCAVVQYATTGPSFNEQTCVVAVSIKQGYPNYAHFNVWYSAKYCYTTCTTTNSYPGVAIAFPEGSTVRQIVYPVRVLIIAPYYVEHGNLTLTFTFAGPVNSSRVQILAYNGMGG